jgi:hypothetical protein
MFVGMQKAAVCGQKMLFKLQKIFTSSVQIMLTTKRMMNYSSLFYIPMTIISPFKLLCHIELYIIRS